MQSSRDLFAPATSATDQLVGTRDQKVAGADQLVAFEEEVRSLIRASWPRPKTAQHLSIVADVTVRQAERILARQQGISLSTFRALARSEHGDKFVALLMRGSHAPWWTEVSHERRLSALRKQRRAVERELRDLEGS